MLAVKIKRVTTKSIKQGTSYREQGLLMPSQKSLERSHPCCLIPVTLSQERHGQSGAVKGDGWRQSLSCEGICSRVISSAEDCRAYIIALHK